MGSILLNDGVDELLSGGSAAQQADAALELRHEWQGVLNEVPSLNRCVSHLPTCKFPGGLQEKHLLTLEFTVYDTKTVIITEAAHKLWRLL